MVYRGGYGADAYGRSQYGSAASEIEPRFNERSTPVDESINVPESHRWLLYELYFYSSSIVMVDPPNDFNIEISENGGVDYVSVYDAGTPYTVDIRFKDGQTVWIRIEKTDGDWAGGAQIIIKTTLTDEFGQPITKVTPVRWEAP